MDRPLLTLSVTSINYSLLEQFLRHHAKLLADPRLEFYIIGVVGMEGNLRKLGEELGYSYKFWANPEIQIVSAKRNEVLLLAQSAHVMFLDDDNSIEEPEKFLDSLEEVLSYERSWVLVSGRYMRYDGQNWLTLPRRQRTGCLGSGIEWNQIYPTKEMIQAGGWQVLFGAGACFAGEAVVLAYQMKQFGIRQTLISDVVIRHPWLSTNAGEKSAVKLRRIRHQQPPLVLFLLRNELISYWGALIWIVRFSIMPFGAGAVSLLTGDWSEAKVRLWALYDFGHGMMVALKDPRIVKCLAPLSRS
jgi:hypothetical protein